MRNNSVKLFEFGQVVQEEKLFKDISYIEIWWPLCLPFVQWSGTICVILVHLEGIMRNNSVKLF